MHFTNLIIACTVAVASVNAGGHKHCSNNNIGMTFDDGVTRWTKTIVDKLVEFGQHATFCINLNNYMCNYDEEAIGVLRYAIEKHMTLCNHGAGHAHMTELTLDQARDEIRKVNKFMMSAFSVTPRYFRFPYGESTPELEAIVTNEFNMEVINWSIDTGDNSGETVDQQIAHYSSLNRDSNDIILAHGNSDEFAYSTLPRILNILKSNQVKSSGMAKCLKEGNYKDGYLHYNYHWKPRKAFWNCNNEKVGGPNGP